MNKFIHFVLSSVLLMFCFFIIGILVYAMIISADFNTLNSSDVISDSDNSLPIPNTDLKCTDPVFISGYYYCNIENITKER